MNVQETRVWNWTSKIGYEMKLLGTKDLTRDEDYKLIELTIEKGNFKQVILIWDYSLFPYYPSRKQKNPDYQLTLKDAFGANEDINLNNQVTAKGVLVPYAIVESIIRHTLMEKEKEKEIKRSQAIKDGIARSKKGGTCWRCGTHCYGDCRS